MLVDFSINTFSAVVHVCKQLGIRHPEELSFCKPLEPNHLKYNYKDMPKKKSEQNGHLPPDTNTFIGWYLQIKSKWRWLIVFGVIL